MSCCTQFTSRSVEANMSSWLWHNRDHQKSFWHIGGCCKEPRASNYLTFCDMLSKTSYLNDILRTIAENLRHPISRYFVSLCCGKISVESFANMLSNCKVTEDVQFWDIFTVVLKNLKRSSWHFLREYREPYTSCCQTSCERVYGPPSASSEVLLPSFLGLDSIEDGLSLSLVALADLLDLLLHLGVQGGQPQTQLLHRPRTHLDKHTHQRHTLTRKNPSSGW